MTRNRNSTGMVVLTVGGEMSVSGDPARAQERLKKRLASELDALRCLLKKAELISRGGGACKGGPPTAGKKEPIEDANAPWVKRRKISFLVEEKQKQIRSPIIETGSKPSSSSSGDSSDTDSDSSGSESDDECSVDRPAQVPPEQKQIIATSEPAQQSTEANKVQDVQRAAPKAVYMPGLLYRANLRRQLLEIERAVLPDQSIHPRDLQRLGISEYGDSSVMRQLGLVLKVDA